MDISRIITISTAHIKEETARLLEGTTENAKHTTFELCVYKKQDYGYFIYLPDDWKDCNIPSDLLDCIKLAVSSECEWLCLDCDGDIVDSIPVYEW